MGTDAPIPKRKSTIRKVIREIVIFVALCAALFAWSVYQKIRYVRSLNPAGIAIVADFYPRFGEPRIVRLHTRESKQYYELFGPDAADAPLLALPSGPPSYIFDDNGRFVEWCTDTGDSRKYEQQWPQSSATPVDLAEFMRMFPRKHSNESGHQ